MIPGHPYLVRAMYEWITDNGLTPHVVVDATHPGVGVPGEYVQEGRIVLNISPTAVQGLSLTNESIDFQARFGGRSVHVHLPPTVSLGIYASEMPEMQMAFPREKPADEGPDHPPEGGPAGGSKGGKAEKRPSLKVVK